MKIFKFITLSLILLTMVFPIFSQENSVVPKRTPEQEALKQTEKLQLELNLNQNQTNQVYEINLKYARERQISNKRSEALERMKNKNTEINQVLSPEQSDKLQSKRYERNYIETNILNHNQSINPSGLRTTSGIRTNQTVHIPSSTDMNLRNNNRPVNTNYKLRIQDQSTKRGTISNHNNPSTIRRSSESSTINSRRMESDLPSRNNTSNTRQQTVPSYIPGRSETPVNTNRK